MSLDVQSSKSAFYTISQPTYGGSSLTVIDDAVLPTEGDDKPNEHVIIHLKAGEGMVHVIDNFPIIEVNGADARNVSGQIAEFAKVYLIYIRIRSSDDTQESSGTVRIQRTDLNGTTDETLTHQDRRLCINFSPSDTTSISEFRATFGSSDDNLMVELTMVGKRTVDAPSS